MKIKAKSLNFDTAVDNDPLLKVWKWKTYGNNVQQIFKVEISRIKVETPTFKLEKSIFKFVKINFKVGNSKFNVEKTILRLKLENPTFKLEISKVIVG